MINIGRGVGGEERAKRRAEKYTAGPDGEHTSVGVEPNKRFSFIFPQHKI